MPSYYAANTDYQLGCVDSAFAEVDLSACSPECFSVVTTPFMKAGGKNCLTQINVAVTPATGSITTSIIDGSAVTFVSATGFITGSSSKASSGHTPLLLADSNITATSISTYSGEGSIGTLIVVGTNTQSGATVSDVCQLWIKDAGQDVVEVV